MASASVWSHAVRYHRCLTAISLTSFAKAQTACQETASHEQQKRNSLCLEDLSPVSPIRIFRPNPRLEIAFDVRTRTPLYVLERMDETKQNKNKAGGGKEKHRRRYRFYEEKRLPEVFRSRNGHYHLSGYDRGHLAPAANFEDMDEENQMRYDSYNLINIAPQKAGMNRKVWHSLERWTRKVASTHKSAYVVTGPLWLPARQLDEKLFEYQYPALGRPPSVLAVPTHFFKLVVVLNNNETVDKENKLQMIQKFACFVVPNEDDQKDRQLEDYMVRLSDLEAVSGLTFFPSMMTEQWKELADMETERLLHSGRRQIKDGRPSQILLLEGGRDSQKSSIAAWGKIRNIKRSSSVDHLCADNQCAHPYNIKK